VGSDAKQIRIKPILCSAEQLLRLLHGRMISTMRIAALIALTVCLLAFPAASQAGHPTLIGRVGLHDAYTISLRTRGGRLVRSLPAGIYTIVIHDYSKLHNFALGSQTANKRLFTTGVAWVGTRSYTLTLTPGHYAYACSVHYQTMNGTFVVTG
jgi:hypothetical protein